VLSSAACVRLLRRLAHLQAAADALDVEVIHPMRQLRHTQRRSCSGGSSEQEEQQDDDEDKLQQLLVDEDAAVQALSQRLLSSPPPQPTPDCLHHHVESAGMAARAAAGGGQAALAAAVNAAAAAEAVTAFSLSLSASERAQAVRDYLIAHSLKDCSICVNAVTSGTEQQTEARCQSQEETTADSGSSWYGQSHRWRLSDSLHGQFRLHVLDLELKSAAAIVDYYRLDADIVRHYLQLTGLQSVAEYRQ
jgi:hypothetical protein